MKTEGCPRYLEEVLQVIGLGMEKPSLITFLDDRRSASLEGAIVIDVEEGEKYEEKLREHILGCEECIRAYSNYIESVKGEESFEETDERYLNLLYYGGVIGKLSAILQSSR